jgi:chitin-binding protein
VRRNVIRQLVLVLGAVAAVAAAPLSAAAVPAGPAAVPAVTTPAPVPPLPPLPTPGQPVASEIRPDAATITWPRIDGPVFRYSVDVLRAEGWVGWVAGPSNSQRMSGLRPGTSYTIRVWAAPLPDSGYSISAPSPEMTFTTLSVWPTPGPTLTPIPTPTPTPASLTCRVTITVWNGGFLLSITITNTTAEPVSGWTLRFRVPATTRITQAWNVQIAQSGSQVTVGPGGWNSTIPPGASISVGMLGSYVPPFQPPDQFELTPGGACEVVVQG